MKQTSSHPHTVEGRHTVKALPNRYIMPFTVLFCGIVCKPCLLIPGLPVWMWIALGCAYSTFTIVGLTGIILVLVMDDLRELLGLFRSGGGL